jgi:hypothetical protein
MSIKSKLTNVGGLLLGAVFLALLLLLLVMIIKGTGWIAVTVLPYLSVALQYAFGISLLVLLPLALIKRLRIVSVFGLGITAMLSGLHMWLISFLAVYSYWGIVGSLIGLAMGGVGVIPLAFIAAAFNGDWSITGDLAYNLGYTLGLFALTAWIASKLDGVVNG